jgi:hypothetical protein
MKRARRGAVRMAAVAAVMLCGASLGACRDSGLPGKNLPRQEARNRQSRYPAYQPAPDHSPVVVAGRQWLGALPIESIPDRMLVPVGSANGQTLYAQRGRQAPYSRIYSRVSEGRWRPYVRLD